MSTVKISVTTPFTHDFGNGRKSWFGIGTHPVPMEVARKAVADGNATFYRHQLYKDE